MVFCQLILVFACFSICGLLLIGLAVKFTPTDDFRFDVIEKTPASFLLEDSEDGTITVIPQWMLESREAHDNVKKQPEYREATNMEFLISLTNVWYGISFTIGFILFLPNCGFFIMGLTPNATWESLAEHPLALSWYFKVLMLANTNWLVALYLTGFAIHVLACLSRAAAVAITFIKETKTSPALSRGSQARDIECRQLELLRSKMEQMVKFIKPMRWMLLLIIMTSIIISFSLPSAL